MNRNIINIICFKHCGLSSIFCKEIPNTCPICHELLSTFLSEPFAIPYPLVNAKEYPCHIVVRPSVGTFLDDYNVDDDLHIGITNPKGEVIEFDKCGIVKNDNVKWRSCAAFYLIPESWESFWDAVLIEMSNDSETWSAANYHETNFNCFNFVIAFLKKLMYKNVQFMDKEELCKEFLLPKIQNIIKFASLYRNLKDKECYVQE